MDELHVENLAEVTLVTIRRPVLHTKVLAALERVVEELAANRRPLVLASQHPRIFLAGAHLAEIAALDAGSSAAYARAGRRVLARLAAHPGPTVAAVDGACSGGGWDLAQACDRVVAGPGARFSHPGVRRGLVTGWGGTWTLPAALGAAAARGAILTGRELDSSNLDSSGWVLVVSAEAVSAAAAEAVRLAGLHPGRLTAWRLLHAGGFVDRFRGVVVHTGGTHDPSSGREPS